MLAVYNTAISVAVPNQGSHLASEDNVWRRVSNNLVKHLGPSLSRWYKIPATVTGENRSTAYDAKRNIFTTDKQGEGAKEAGLRGSSGGGSPISRLTLRERLQETLVSVKIASGCRLAVCYVGRVQIYA